MHNIKTNFDKIFRVLKDILSHEINEKDNYKRRGSVPKFSDIEVIAMSLMADKKEFRKAYKKNHHSKISFTGFFQKGKCKTQPGVYDDGRRFEYGYLHFI